MEENAHYLTIKELGDVTAADVSRAQETRRDRENNQAVLEKERLEREQKRIEWKEKKAETRKFWEKVKAALKTERQELEQKRLELEDKKATHRKRRRAEERSKKREK